MNDWHTLLFWLLSHPEAARVLLGAVALVGLFAGLYVAFNFRYERSSRQAAFAAREKLGVAALEADLRAREVALEEAIATAVRRRLSAFINSILGDSWEMTLPQLSARGLAEVRDSQYEIPTEAKKRILEYLGKTRAGSVGVAGPRGAGKTTVLQSFCLGQLPDEGDLKILNVLTEAPVKYNSRDFILLIFSFLCQRIIRLNLGGTLEQQRDDLEAGSLRLPPVLEPLALLLIPMSAILILLSLSLAWLDITYKNQLGPFAPSFEVQTQQSKQISPPTVQTPQVSRATPPKVQAQPSATPTQGTPPTASKPVENMALEYVRALKISPAPLLIWGLILGMLGIILFYLRQQDRLGPLRVRERKERGLSHLNKEMRTLVESAIRELDEIRFQQSNTSGWSGSLNFPVALKIESTSSVTQTRNPKTLPEIVTEYRALVEEAVKYYKIIIGIDELDKLESDDAARQFLNDIKAIFRLDGCFYLISISESAISSFQRRGLNFRDAFDSALDETVYVDYLSLDGSKELLKRRERIPVPFVCLCHCLSGGLPRDLIRTCREMVRLADSNNKLRSRASLCHSLVQVDVKSKLRALAIAAKDIKVEPDTSQLLHRLWLLESAAAFTPNDLFANSHPQAEASVSNSRLSPERAKIAALTAELEAFLYFSATLLAFFNEGLTSETLEAAVKAGNIDALAKTRQALGDNPQLAKWVISEFRAAQHMEAQITSPTLGAATQH